MIRTDQEPVSPANGAGRAEIDDLRTRLLALREEVIRCDQRLASRTDQLPESARRSAKNLIHYLALRRVDLRPLQEALATAGLSSLGRSEAHVLATLDAVLGLLERPASWQGSASGGGDLTGLSRRDSRALLAARTDALFGPRGEGRAVRIMVTASDEAATNYGLVRDLLASGMDCLRINCAHGDQEQWAAMIGNLRRAEREVGVRCRVLMDLAGPRARVGALAPGPAVVKIRPHRDPLGRVTRPARIWLTAQEAPRPSPEPADAAIQVPAEFLREIGPGDRVRLTDSRDARRILCATPEGQGCWAELTETAYITTGTPLELLPPVEQPEAIKSVGEVGPLPPLEQSLHLEVGDRLILTRSQEPGRPAAVADGRPGEPARVPCLPPEVLDDIATGEPIWFDEGRIGGVVESTSPEQAVVTITSTAWSGATLAPDKGINLPRTQLKLPSLTERDRANLPFVAEHAELVGYSFVRTAHDVEELLGELDTLGATRLGVVLKIETSQAFEEFPSIVLAALRREAVGVMIARGDLAVECGFTRLAEIQEELLWLCEAAHLPVTLATQVLEKLAKQGRPSRAEITDAALGVRAECVMLNKGRHIVEAVRALDSILVRMQAHLEKKQSLLRALEVADRFFAEAAAEPASSDRRG